MPDEALAPEKEGPLYPDVERVRKPQYFKYEKPDVTSTKASIKLSQSDILKAAVQVVRPGGENNLHSHAVSDTCWMVLKGRARFYGDGDEVLGEFSQYEGIMTPRGTRYWFESADENEDLELLQMAAKLRGEKDIRTNHNPRPESKSKETQHFSAKVNR
jgi:mannose-6-phosphate isomerase-like protein (cupin superfamily)